MQDTLCINDLARLVPPFPLLSSGSVPYRDFWLDVYPESCPVCPLDSSDAPSPLTRSLSKKGDRVENNASSLVRLLDSHVASGTLPLP